MLGPQAGTPRPDARVQIPVVYRGDRVAELVVDGCDDRAFLDRVAALISAHCLVGWDTGGVPWQQPQFGVTRIRVEDRVDAAQRVHQRAQRFDVADLDRVPVLRELILDDAAVGDDVRAVLGERPRDVLEEPRPVPRVDRDLHAERLRPAAVPLDRREPLRLPLAAPSRSGSPRDGS